MLKIFKYDRLQNIVSYDNKICFVACMLMGSS